MNDDFTHDPIDSREIPGGALSSFEEAKSELDDGEGEGLGIALARHDPFLVVEVANGLVEDELPDPVESILAALGDTFTEADEGNLLRLIYKGNLPDGLHGGDPVIVTVGGEERNYAFRMFDSGWTPVTGKHIAGTPEDVETINEGALRGFLTQSGKL